MGLSTKKILGVNISIASNSKVLEEVGKYFKTKNQEPRTKNKNLVKPLIIYTPNPEIIVYAQKDSEFKRIVNSAQINIADGAGVVWAVRKIYGDKIKKVSGVDLMFDLCDLASNQGLTVGLIGGSEEVAVATAECLSRKYRNLRVEVFQAPEIILNEKEKVAGSEYSRIGGIHDAVDAHSSQTASGQGESLKKINKLTTNYLILNTGNPQSEETNKYFNDLVEDITHKNIDVLFVAFGFPKQEYFIAQIARTMNQEPPVPVGTGQARTKNKNISSKYSVLSSKLPSKPLVLMAVGGAFDYISGKKTRAPMWMREIGLEWLYRLIREPSRLLRQLRGAEFFYKILKQFKAIQPSNSTSGVDYTVLAG